MEGLARLPEDTERSSALDEGRNSNFGSLHPVQFLNTGQLQVPACFTGSFSCKNHALGSSAQADPDQVMEQVFRSFTKSMRHGVEVQVLLDDGGVLEVDASFDMNMTKLVLKVKEVERDIPLEDIEQVCGPDEAQAAGTTNREHLSERTTTLVMSSTHFLTFVFDTPRHREYFQTCLSAIVISHRKQLYSARGRGYDYKGAGY